MDKYMFLHICFQMQQIWGVCKATGLADLHAIKINVFFPKSK